MSLDSNDIYPDILATFTRSLDERYEVFRTRLASVVNSFGGDKNFANKKKHVEDLYLAARDLESLLNSADQPGWLGPILQFSKQFIDDPSDRNSVALLNRITRHSATISPVVVKTDKRNVFDVDEIYRRTLEEGKLPQLFEQIIEIIERIIQSREVQDLTVFEAMNRLAKVLRANQNGSYAAVKLAINLAEKVKDTTLGYLQDNQSLAKDVDDFNKIVNEAKVEHSILENEMDQKVLGLLLDEFQLTRLGSIREKYPLADFKKIGNG